MTTAKPFYDLCIENTSYQNLTQLAAKLLELGYRTVAINRQIDIDNLDTGGNYNKPRKGESRTNFDYVPLPFDTTALQKQYSELTILTRLTVVFSLKENMHRVMQSANMKKYDLLAVIPKSLEALQFTCQNLEADIISFDPTENKMLKISRKLYYLAIERNMYFEVMYSPAIYDQSNRKNTINRSHMYHASGKARNIIITSNASSFIQVRGPYDIINLGLILGLSEEQSKYSISQACTNVLNRALGRHIGKAIVAIRDVNKDKQNNQAKDQMEVDEEPIQKKLKPSISDDIILLE